MQPVNPPSHDLGPVLAGASARTTPLHAGVAGALMESRQRWRDLALLGADLTFETDAGGRLGFFECARASELGAAGWDAPAWLGRAARELLAQDSPDPFTLRAAARDIRAWLRRPDGAPACFSFSVAPLFDPRGAFAGLRGVGRDITADTLTAQAQAAVQRRAEALEALVGRVRAARLAPQMLAAMLQGVPAALGLAGTALLETGPDDGLVPVERYGGDPAPLLGHLPPVLPGSGWHFLRGPGAEPLGLLAAPRRVAPYRALLVWRDPGGRGFDADDRHMLAALSDLLFVVLGNHLLQRELERQARTEPLTGLLNRRAFLDDLQRRLDRQARTRAAAPAGSLLFIDLDLLKPLNDRFGHGAGDAALNAVARLLREFARPTDLAGRLGGDEFGLWLDGADATAATRRAAALCTAMRHTTAVETGHRGTLSLSIGCAVAAADGLEPPEALLARADSALYAAKRQGRDGWTLADPPAAPTETPMHAPTGETTG